MTSMCLSTCIRLTHDVNVCLAKMPDHGAALSCSIAAGDPNYYTISIKNKSQNCGLYAAAKAPSTLGNCGLRKIPSHEQPLDDTAADDTLMACASTIQPNCLLIAS